MSSLKKTAAVGSILWITIAISAYFVVHKPWGASQSLAPLLAGADLILALALIGLAGGVGRWIIPSPSGLSARERAALQAGLGLGILGGIVLVLGLLGLLKPLSLWILLVFGLIALRPKVVSWGSDLAKVPRSLKGAGLLAWLAAALVGILLLVSLLQAMAPPLKWDALVYHLEFPKQYLLTGRIAPVGDTPFEGMPHLAEMLYTWSMGLRAGTTAAVLGWGVGVLALIGLAGYCGRLLGSRASWLAPVVLLSGASFSRGLAWAYTDWWMVLFGMGMLICLERYSRTQTGGILILGGVFAGLGVATKYTGVILPIAGMLVLAAGEGDWRRKAKATGLLAGVAIAVFLPWVLRNLVFLGNPIYPFFFPTEGMNALRQGFYSGPVPKRSILRDILLPWEATILGVEGAPGYATSSGALILAFVPAVLLGWRSFKNEARRALRQLLFVALTLWIVWALGAHISGTLSQARLYWGLFPALAALAAAGFEVMASARLGKIRMGRVAGSLVVLTMVLVVVGEGLQFADGTPLPVLAGHKAEEEFLAEKLGWFSPVMQALNRLPPDSDVLFLWEPRTYYCQVSCRSDGIIDRWYATRRQFPGATSILDEWRGMGVTHVLVHRQGAEFVRSRDDRYTTEDWQSLNHLLSMLREIEVYADAYSLYEVPR